MSKLTMLVLFILVFTLVAMSIQRGNDVSLQVPRVFNFKSTPQNNSR